VTTLDLTLLPLYRLHQQEITALPGLLALTPPRKTARGREHDRLVVYLILTGNATLSAAEYLQLTSQTASRFFATPGALTTAMRAAADALNRTLLDRNLDSTARGQYAIGWLVLAALRGAQCTMLQSGPTHIFTLGSEAVAHTFDPALSGKGLGLGQAVTTYFTQTELHPGDWLIFSGKPPVGWERALSQMGRDSVEMARRRLLSLSREDVNAVLVQASAGTGSLTVLRPTPSTLLQTSRETTPKNEPSAPPTGTSNLPPSQRPDSLPQPGTPVTEPEAGFPPGAGEEPAFTPSAYAIPPQGDANGLPEIDQVIPEFPASIPRLAPAEPEAPPLREMDEPIMAEPKEPRQPSETTRKVARGLVGGMRAWRRMVAALGNRLGKLLPNLLPARDGASSSALSSNFVLALIAVAVPLMVVTAGFVIYYRFGRNIQYDRNMLEAENARTRAVSAADPARERTEWQAVLFHLREAEKARNTPELNGLRVEAQSKLDALEGKQRLNFYPALSSGIGAQISRLAANETDLYMLDAVQGRVLHAGQVGRSFEIDTAFHCEGGDYGEYRVGPIVDILILPRLNSLNAAVLGIDATGTLLYCAPGQVGQAIPLPIPDTNWGHITGFTYDSGNLYVLDAQSRAVWVYTGQDASFVDAPYFFFGGQIPKIEDSIDLVVNGDELYLLHADGHLSHCSYSRLDTVPTRCDDPAPLINTIPAYKDSDLFGQSHLTQMMLTSPPDSTLLMLDADNHSVMRFSPRTLELLNQIYPMPGTSFKPGPAGAMTVNPNRVLFLAVDDQVYFATDMP
jgi:hypothetical protein